MHRIPKSFFTSSGTTEHDFREAAERHKHELELWTAHQRKCIDHEPDHQPYPPPHAHPSVDAAVQRLPKGKFDIAFEVFDDGPTKEAIEVEARNGLLGMISGMETQLLNRLWGVPGKRRLNELLHAEYLAVPEEDRTPEMVDFLKGREELARASQRVQRWAAEQHAAIEDLTIEQMKTWKPAPIAE